MLEDESGRLRLTGTMLQSTILVTGAIVAVLGTENANGDFEVLDVKVPDLPSQPERWERSIISNENGKRKRGSFEGHGDNSEGKRKKIALVSGLGITGTSGDTLPLSLLTDYLLGYNDAHAEDSDGSVSASQISRLVIAGNSLGSSVTIHPPNNEASANGSSASNKKKPSKKYGYDAASYNAAPISQLDSFLAEILPTIPVTLMPGETDPANYSLPQQEIHRAMLPRSKAYCSPPGQTAGTVAEPGWLDNVTNPWEGDVEGWRFWGCSGQNLDDVLRYVDIDGEDDYDGASGDLDARLRLMEAMLRWRCAVPTAPDTLCMSLSFPCIEIQASFLILSSGCYPFQSHDPFTLQSCPHVFFAGNQPYFKTAIVESGTSSSSSDIDDGRGSHVRILTLPKFSETGEIVLIDSETLDVEVVKFGTFNKTDAGDSKTDI